MRIAWLCLLLLVCGPLFGGVREVPRGSEYFELWFLADIVIAADGSVARQSWRNFTDMPEPALRDLERKIATWKFSPAEIAGEPVETETSLVVMALAIKGRRQSKFRVEISHAVVGPSLEDGRWPEDVFPEALESDRWSGALVHDITVVPGETPAVEWGEFIGNEDDRAFKAALKERARFVVDGWRVRHERVAGHPVPAQFRHRVMWCSSYLWCRDKVPGVMAGLPEMPGGQPTPVHSVTRLLTDVAEVRKPAGQFISTSNPLYPPFAPAR